MTLHRRGITREGILAALAGLLEREHQQAVLPALSHWRAHRSGWKWLCARPVTSNERYLGLMEALHGQLPEIYHEPGDGEVLTRGPFVDALKRILQDGVIEGTLAVPDDLDETATLVFNATGWTYREMRSGHRWPPEKARERVVHLLVAGDAAVTATVSPAAAGRVDLRTMSRLSLGHVFVDMTQGAVPALLPTLIATRGLNLASASALVSIATIGSAVLQPLVRDLG